MKRFCVLLALCTGVVECSPAQDSLHTKPVYLHSGKIGLGIDGIGGSPNLLVIYYPNNQLAIQVILGVELDWPGGTPPSGQTKVIGRTVRGGVSSLFHVTQDQVSIYVGLEGIFQNEKPGGFYAVDPDPRNSILVGGVFGPEYFIGERFTVGIKNTLGVNILLKRNNPKEETDIRLNTSAVFTGRFYFN